MKEAIFTTITALAGGVLVLGLVIALIAWPVQLLWNASLAPAIDGVNEIGFVQAIGICFLVGLLFGSNNASTSKASE